MAWIRNKKTGEVLEAALNITPSSDWELSYDKPAPEPRWQDVTGDIAVDNWGALYNTKMGAVVFGTSNPTHRLRKVQFDTYLSGFIVERKVEP